VQQIDAIGALAAPGDLDLLVVVDLIGVGIERHDLRRRHNDGGVQVEADGLATLGRRRVQQEDRCTPQKLDPAAISRLFEQNYNC
jgi:hypothetical protein